MRRRTALALAVALLAAATPATTRAQDAFAQSFTAPTTPAGFVPFLTRLATPSKFTTAGGTNNPGLDLFAFDGTQFVGPALFSQTLDLSNGFQVFPNVALLPGQLYILSFRDSDVFESPGWPVNDFAGGALQGCTDGRACRDARVDVPGFSADFATRAVPSTVPEPATWALMGTGLIGVGAVARRRMA